MKCNITINHKHNTQFFIIFLDGLKLCDFGISRIVEESGSKVREILGTPDYVAPEVNRFPLKHLLS